MLQAPPMATPVCCIKILNTLSVDVCDEVEKASFRKKLKLRRPSFEWWRLFSQFNSF